MKSRIFCFAVPLVGAAMSFADMPPQPPPSLTMGVVGDMNLDWSGVAGRTYFTQWSEDLVDWRYFPDIEHGSGAKSSGFSSTAPKFFVRLRYTDVPTASPELADFDADGIGNIEELNLGTSPLDADTDKDGIADGQETINGTDPLSDADGDLLRRMDSDGDGISDVVEVVNGTSPTLSDSDGDGYSDKDDAFPLDPTRHMIPALDSGDTTKPIVTLEAPGNAVPVSGP